MPASEGLVVMHISGEGEHLTSGLGPPMAVTSIVGVQVRATARARACAAAAVWRVDSTLGCLRARSTSAGRSSRTGVAAGATTGTSATHDKMANQ